ncbi:MAG: hypothetical protein DLM68_19135 [Hyphomicrobiales bacterium]|nr:MAG: hypothetical protein DLM68_19135 [Hyphomicrobiales bacterium]
MTLSNPATSQVRRLTKPPHMRRIGTNGYKRLWQFMREPGPSTRRKTDREFKSYGGILDGCWEQAYRHVVENHVHRIKLRLSVMLNETWQEIASVAGSNHSVVAAGAHSRPTARSAPGVEYRGKLTMAPRKHCCSPQHRLYFS